MSNSIGEKFRITSFGSSHGKAVGAIVDGCPANLKLSSEDIQKELNKRKPGTSSVTTPRKEDDEIQILSGIFEGKTDGTPITGVIFNKNQHSKDYSMFKNTPRPSHGDYGWMMKYGNYDYNGGGRGLPWRIVQGYNKETMPDLVRKYGIPVIKQQKKILKKIQSDAVI